MATDWVAWAVSAALVLPAILFAAGGSSLLVDYTIFLYVFNREIRRVLDWSQGSFNPFSPIVLVPLIATCLLLLPVFGRFRFLHSTPKLIFILFFLAIGYGTLVGLARNGVAAVYAASEYLSPVALMGFTATAPVYDSTADRWIKNAGWLTVAACLYGWYQYVTIPPWDAFWVEQVGFVGYLGKPAPFEMTVFATFAERGPCASFLAMTVICIIVSRRWRVVLGWPESLLILSTIVLTFVRTGLILVAVGVLIHPIINRGKSGLSIVVLLAVIAAASTLGLNRIPNSDRINRRLSTLGNLQEDGSYRGRADIANVGAKLMISNPAGFGIGSSGLGGRLNSGSVKSESVIGDNGYFEVLTSVGVPGGICLAAAFFLLWRHLSICARFGFADDYIALSRTFLIVFVIGMFIGNYFSGLSVMWIVFGRALSPTILDKLLSFCDHSHSEAPETFPAYYLSPCQSPFLCAASESPTP
jgi:putative inorganic carbon (hco3(-)) transporter